MLLIEPYYGGSHQAWADGYARHSQYDVKLLTLPAQFWKWRMQGGAVTLARMVQEGDFTPDIILVSDMMDVSLFCAILRQSMHDVPVALYFHENQLTYPQNSRQKHGWQYGFINYASAMAADVLYFNSTYHMQNFFAELPRMLKHFADNNESQTVTELREKSSVLPLGLDLRRFDAHFVNKDSHSSPLIVWNHRWEADKNPTAFFDALYTLADEGYDFRLALFGENFRQHPLEFEAAKARFGTKIIQYGYAESWADYARTLWQADYIVSTAYQDFFGIAVSEGIYCDCVPILANRLNYPFLIPDSYHRECLFRDGALKGLLEQHLNGTIKVDTTPLKQNIARYDWAMMIGEYDKRLAGLLS
ncbi:MAG: DUF3524 domain-containing protein [Anaerolineae bacterium]|nr:DUF3524 domain-containing protein [Anaerolineae bacterium]